MGGTLMKKNFLKVFVASVAGFTLLAGSMLAVPTKAATQEKLWHWYIGCYKDYSLKLFLWSYLQ